LRVLCAYIGISVVQKSDPVTTLVFSVITPVGTLGYQYGIR